MTSQEKKQYLSQYLYICDEIEDLLHDLEEWYTIAGKVTASYSGTPGGGSSDKLNSVVAKILEIKDSCAERLERMERNCGRVKRNPRGGDKDTVQRHECAAG